MNTDNFIRQDGVVIINPEDGTEHIFNFYTLAKIVTGCLIHYQHMLPAQAETCLAQYPPFSKPVDSFHGAMYLAHEHAFHWAMMARHGHGYWNQFPHLAMLPAGYDEWEENFIREHQLADDIFAPLVPPPDKPWLRMDHSSCLEINAEANTVLEKLGPLTTVKIERIGIHHSSTVQIIVRGETGTPVCFKFYYTRHFKGDVHQWTNARLHVAYVKRIRVLGRRHMPEYQFEFTDSNNNFSIRANSLSIDYNPAPDTTKQSFPQMPVKGYGEDQLENLKTLLRQRVRSRVQLFNSVLPSLYLQLNNNVNNIFLESERPEDPVLDVVCEGVTYMDIDIHLWETTKGISIDRERDHFLITDPENNYQIRCQSVEISSNKAGSSCN